MGIEGFLNRVCQEIKYEPVRKGIAEELEVHIQDIKEGYINNGMQEMEAEEKAVSQMGVAEDIGKKLNKIHRPKLDWKLLLLVLILMGFGMLVAILKQPLMNDNYIGSTISYMLIGSVLSLGIYFFNYIKMKNYSNVIYFVASLIMILPILKIGCSINGIYYIRIFNIIIFPPTIALPLYIIAFIGYVVSYNRNNIIKITILNKKIAINKDFLKIAIFCIISLLLMMNIPSITNAGILGVAYLVIITVKIVQDKEQYLRKLLILYGMLSILAISFLFIMLIGSPFRVERIIASFNPETDPQGTGYIGMLQKEILEKAKIVGEAETRAISDERSIINVESSYTFIYLLGKTGLLVAGILVITIILTSIKLIYNARKIKEEYGKFIIIGLGTLYILQSLATILMNLNIGIQTNINLPFVTYGGVYFVVNLLNIAIILSIYRRKDINEYEEKDNTKSLTVFKIGESI